MPATPIAIAIGDAHMSHDVPVARGETRTEWYDAMKRTWQQVSDIAHSYSESKGRLAILAPGDVVHRWNEPHELTNWLFHYMPGIDAVPGNHDLPDHDMKQLHRSAYWTLVRTNRISHRYREGCLISHNPNVIVNGFGYGEKVEFVEVEMELSPLRIALIHDMIWSHDRPYPGVEETKHAGFWSKKLQGYDVAVFGDNHQTVFEHAGTFSYSRTGPKGSPSIINCGTLMRRRANERDHKPCVAVIYDDASITLEYLNCTKDKWREDIDEVIEVMSEYPDHGEEVMETLRALSDTAVDFIDAVRRCAEKTKNKRTRALLIRYAEEVENGR